VLGLVDTAREGVRHLVGVALVHEGRESKRLLPEKVDHVFEIIDPFFKSHLEFFEGILPIVEFALEELFDNWRGEFAFTHGDGDPDQRR